MKNTATILNHYLACALWASNDDEGEPLDSLYGFGDIDLASVTAATAEIEAFLAECAAAGLGLDGISDELIGHDIWLTRNHHGAGFWDRGLGDMGDKLTEIAHSLGGCDAYVGDDGKVHLS
jgi:hypothetical protein